METLKRNLINLGKGFIVWFILLLLNTRSNEVCLLVYSNVEMLTGAVK